MTIEVDVGAKIKGWRLKRNLTQKGLAKQANISESLLQKYELNIRKPKIETLTKIAAALDVPVTVFISYNIQGVSIQEEEPESQYIIRLVQKIASLESEINSLKTTIMSLKHKQQLAIEVLNENHNLTERKGDKNE